MKTLNGNITPGINLGAIHDIIAQKTNENYFSWKRSSITVHSSFFKPKKSVDIISIPLISRRSAF